MRLGHVALTAEDPKALAAFYERFLGLQRVGEAQTEQGGAMVFLSSEPGGPPELQVMSNLQGRHVAFRVDSLAELRDLYAEAPQRGEDLEAVPQFAQCGAEQLDVAAAGLVAEEFVGSLLDLPDEFLDADGNSWEVYWETGRRSSGGVRPIDLAKSEEELLELIRA